MYGLKNISPTDSACSWVAPSGSAATTSSVDILYPSSRKDYIPTDEPLREEDKIWFREELKKLNRFTGFYWLLQDKPTTIPEHFPWLTVKDVLQQHKTTEDILSALMLTADDIPAIAERTKGQRDNHLWFDMRFGRLTASNFGSILTAIDNKRFSKSLYSKLLGSMSLENVRSIQYGINHEEAAIHAFEVLKDLKVEQTGIWLDQSGLLGASPDGLVGVDAIVEVKCPYKHRNSSREEVLCDKMYCFEELDDGDYDIKENHPYYQQIQGQLHIMNRTLCYFVVYGPNFLIIMQVPKDPEWGANLGKLREFYVDYFLKKLMD